MTLVEFLTARLDEREQEARIRLADTISQYGMSELDPDRLLAEVEAKRRIVNEHYVFQDAVQACRQCSDKRAEDDPLVRADRWVTLVPGPCSTVRLLALPYADHADYRDEWRP